MITTPKSTSDYAYRLLNIAKAYFNTESFEMRVIWLKKFHELLGKAINQYKIH